MSEEVMPQIALRIPASILNKIDALLAKARASARAKNQPTSFCNRSTIVRTILECGLPGAAQTWATPPAPLPHTTRTTARTAAKKNRPKPR